MNNMYDFEKIAQRIKAVRIDKNITQAYVAKKCNVSRSTVIKWEKGESFPELNSMLKLCNLYDCELGYLLCETGYENGKRETTDICKATGLSQEAVETLVYNETTVHERPVLAGYASKEKQLVNTILMESNYNFIGSLYSYAYFEYERQALSELFDLDILNRGGVSMPQVLDEWMALYLAKLLINKKIPIINKDIFTGGEIIKAESLEIGADLFDSMMESINSMNAERKRRIAIDKDATIFEYYDDVLDYEFSENEKITLCYLLNDFGDVVQDPSGKINQFAIVETFKDFLRENIENIHGGFAYD